MVKGVHKKVIEVHQPDSAYFEKAIFYLRPGITQLPPELAQAAAREYLQELEPNPLPPFWKRTLPLFSVRCSQQRQRVRFVLQCCKISESTVAENFPFPQKLYENQKKDLVLFLETCYNKSHGILP